MGKRTVKDIENIIHNEMKYEGVTVLTYHIEYPEFISKFYCKPIIALNKYYKSKAIEYQNYCKTTLYNMAVEQYLEDIKNRYPIRVFEALKVYKMTYNMACIISLYFDQYEFTGGAHGLTVRSSQTWNLKTGKMLKLSELFDCLFDYKAYIINNVMEQIKKEPELYFDNYEELVEQTFDVNNFYCTPKGLAVYFQQYDIAPYSSGIRQFFLPYNDYVIDPVNKCKVK